MVRRSWLPKRQVFQNDCLIFKGKFSDGKLSPVNKDIQTLFRGAGVIVVENEHGDSSSNPGRVYLHFQNALIHLGKVLIHVFSVQLWVKQLVRLVSLPLNPVREESTNKKNYFHIEWEICQATSEADELF